MPPDLDILLFWITGSILAVSILSFGLVATNSELLFKRLTLRFKRYSLPGMTRERFDTLVNLDRAAELILAKQSHCRRKLLMAALEERVVHTRLFVYDAIAQAFSKLTRHQIRSTGERDDLLQEVELHTAESKRLNDELISIRFELDNLYTTRKSVVADARAFAILAKFGAETQTHTAILQRIEDRIRFREELAQDRIFHALFEKTESNPIGKNNELQVIQSILGAFAKSFNRLNEVYIAADPNIDRAYHRLYAQYLSALVLAANSTSAEDDLEMQLFRLHGGTLPDRGLDTESYTKKSKSQNDTPSVEVQPDETSDETIESVSQILKMTRRRNFLIDQRLFFLKEVLLRLSNIKLLLDALPRKKRNELIGYALVVSSLERFISAMNDSSNLPQNDSSLEISRRISELEDRCLMAFIGIAKEKKVVSRSLAITFNSNMCSTVSGLKKKISNQAIEIEKWNQLSVQMSEGGNNFAALFACHRRDRCISVTGMMEKSVEIINLVVLSFINRLQEEDAESSCQRR